MSTTTAFVPRPARRHFMMYTPRARMAFEHQQFFFEHSTRLSSLLNTVSNDARANIDQPSTSTDYYELTSAVTQLLCEAQSMSALTFDQIERAGVLTEPFAERVRVAEEVAERLRSNRRVGMDVEMVGSPMSAAAASSCSSLESGSRKRGMEESEEEMDTDEEEMAWSQFERQSAERAAMPVVTKRLRHAPVEHSAFSAPAFCGPYAERIGQVGLWSQPVSWS